MNDRAKVARGTHSAATVTTLLQSACDRLPVGFALFDADLGLAAWNARFAALRGYPRKLVKLGTPLESFVRFDAERGAYGAGAIDPLTRRRLTALKRGQRTDCEQALPDGRILHIASEPAPPGGVLLLYEDVTETRGTEERLRESAARYELALRGISEGFYDWDIGSGTVHYSERVRHAVGLAPEELKTPGDWFARIHPDDQPKYRAASAAHFKGETERFECEYRYRARDGSWRWARQHGVALRDAGGRAYRMVGSTGDITELKRVEEALRESEERHAFAMRAAVEGIYEWNVETDALFLSDQAKAFFALPAEKLAPEDWNARVHPKDLEAYRRALVDHFKGRTPNLELEYRIRDAVGGYRWVLDRGIAVRGAKGRVTRLIGALSDITQRKLAEIELRRACDEATAALAEQTALREVLEAISRSAFDLDAVLRTLIEHATRLAGADKGFIFRLEGDVYRLAVDFGAPADFREFIERNPIRADSAGVVGLTARAGRTVHIEDATTDPRFRWHESQRLGRFRTVIGVPMLREGAVIGVIALWKERVEPFTQAEIDLVTTFSNQALIAIENARLFGETKEALEHQTATAEILRLISTFPSELQPVLDGIAESAARLCDARDSSIFQVTDDILDLAAAHAEFPIISPGERLPINWGLVVGRAVLGRQLVHVPDLASAEAQAEFPESAPRQRRFGTRTILAMPLLREGTAIGVILIRRLEVRPFTDKQISLLKTFADQAVIAIENVRLFQELQAKNRELTEALEQQTATAETLRVISSSPTDLGSVYQTILSSITRLCEANIAALFLYDGEVLTNAASHGTTVEFAEHLARGRFRPSRETTSRLAALERRTVQVADLLADPAFAPQPRELYEQENVRTVLSVPLLREDALVGVITTWRREVRPFTDKHVALVRTFADQAVIAIENVRLFNETKEALERQTATAEILKVIASSPADEQPVFDAIVAHAGRIAGGCSVNVSRLVGDELHLAAYTKISLEADDVLKSAYPVAVTEVRPLAEAVRRKASFFVRDFETDPDVSRRARELMRARGFRSTVYVPILRGNVVYGVMHVSKVEPGPFPDHWVSMLRTFADQAVIAIENVRLFNETKEALERQTATADILRVISSSLTDLAPVFDAILENAIQLCDGDVAVLWRYEGHVLRFAAGKEISPEAETLLRQHPLELGGYNPTPQAALERRPVHVLDVFGAPGYRPLIPTGTLTHRPTAATVLAVPLLREGELLGVISVWRHEKRLFTDKQVEMVNTFAAQAVIAIENARLFNETKEALDQQKASAEVLQVISSSVADTTPVFDKILESSERLFQGRNLGICVVGDDGAIHLSAYHGPNREELMRHFPVPLTEASGNGTAILQRRVIHYPDIEAKGVPDYARRGGRIGGNRSVLFAPMLWEGRGIGSIFVGRATVGEFSEKEIGLLKTFADQAVIAIQNTRLFREIEEKSHQLEIADQHKSAFLANMSHELRTPLNAVIGFSEMLAARYFGELTAKQAEYVNDIHGSGKHLLSLINDILDLSKIEAGRMERDLAEFDLRGALDNALTLVRERAQRGGVALRLETDPRLGTYRGDERKLKQVVLNLLSNAVKFTPSGGSVSVVAKQVDGNAEIAVRDTGVGIAPADQEAIFEAFRQVGTDVTRKREGTGLGLALARRFVELHGGTIRVESAPGKGSTFTVRLPIRHGE